MTVIASSHTFTIATLTCLLGCLPTVVLAQADRSPDQAPDLLVSPAVIEWQLPVHGRSQVRVRIVNPGDATLELSGEIGSWSFAPDGGVRLGSAEPGALSGRLQVHPPGLRLGPGEQRSLRLWLPEVDGLAEGEHRALLRLHAQPVAGGVPVRFDLAVYAWRGAVQADARVESGHWRRCGERIEASLLVANQGNRHARLDGWLVVQDVDGLETRTVLPRTPVLPSDQSWLHVDLPWAGPLPTAVALQGRLGGRELDPATDAALAARTCE